MNILKSLKNTKGKVFNFFGYENKVKIKFPFVTLVYSILYIIFNLINKNVEQDKPVKFYEDLKKHKLRYFFLYIHSIGDGAFTFFRKNKAGNFIKYLVYLLFVSLITELLVGHKQLLLYILIGIFVGYFVTLQYNYLSNKISYKFPTRPSCCGSFIYTFLTGVSIFILFNNMNNYKGRLLMFILFILILFAESYNDYISFEYTREQDINFLNENRNTVDDDIIEFIKNVAIDVGIDIKDNQSGDKVFNDIIDEYINKTGLNIKGKGKDIFGWYVHVYLMGIVVGLLNNTIKF
uniref:Uncharacterized protein n=1 Tax=viral metagenome TaxID=1070528 RepID=A0A6C0EFF7_9ZZZZ